MQHGKFFNDQVIIMTKTFRTIANDTLCDELGEILKNTPIYKEAMGPLPYIVAMAYVYTNGMVFEWHEDVPEAYKEAFAGLSTHIQNHSPFDTVYKYCLDNIPQELILDWNKTVKNCLTLWKPEHERATTNTTDPK